MGLDMFLTRRHYIGGMYDYDGHHVEGSVDVSINGKQLPIDIKKLKYIEEDVGYWRKANQIHRWFVVNVQDGVDDCRPYEVEIEQLRDLLILCKDVDSRIILVKAEDGTEVIENTSEIASLLPRSDGFFFGSTDYGRWYADQIKSTIEILEKVIVEDHKYRKEGFYPEYEYLASW